MIDRIYKLFGLCRHDWLFESSEIGWMGTKLFIYFECRKCRMVKGVEKNVDEVC